MLIISNKAIRVTKSKKIDYKVYRYSEFHVTHAIIFSLLIITIYSNRTIQSKGTTYYMTSVVILQDMRFISLNLFRRRY